MTAAYDGAAAGWAAGSVLVYRPLARALVARSPHPLAGRCVLDVGAGTGAGSEALAAVGASPVALDLSFEMLSWERTRRSPAVVASATAPPIGAQRVDDVLCPFVLNHLDGPVPAMRGLAACARPGGAFLASVYSTASQSPARDRIDEVLGEHGWEPPAWYRRMKATMVPLLGAATRMRDAAVEAGLDVRSVEEVPVDVGVERAVDLVAYRLGQAQFAPYLATLGDARRDAVREAAVRAVEPIMEPFRPTVVFLVARTR